MRHTGPIEVLSRQVLFTWAIACTYIVLLAVCDVLALTCSDLLCLVLTCSVLFCITLVCLQDTDQQRVLDSVTALFKTGGPVSSLTVQIEISSQATLAKLAHRSDTVPIISYIYRHCVTVQCPSLQITDHLNQSPTPSSLPALQVWA